MSTYNATARTYREYNGEVYSLFTAITRLWRGDWERRTGGTYRWESNRSGNTRGSTAGLDHSLNMPISLLTMSDLYRLPAKQLRFEAYPGKISNQRRPWSIDSGESKCSRVRQWIVWTKKHQFQHKNSHSTKVVVPVRRFHVLYLKRDKIDRVQTLYTWNTNQDQDKNLTADQSRWPVLFPMILVGQVMRDGTWVLSRRLVMCELKMR